jgi:hypothetical protein
LSEIWDNYFSWRLDSVGVAFGVGLDVKVVKVAVPADQLFDFIPTGGDFQNTLHLPRYFLWGFPRTKQLFDQFYLINGRLSQARTPSKSPLGHKLNPIFYGQSTIQI